MLGLFLDWISTNWDRIKITFAIVGIASTTHSIATAGYHYVHGITELSKLNEEKSAALEGVLNQMNRPGFEAALTQYYKSEQKYAREFPKHAGEAVEGAVGLVQETYSMQLDAAAKASE